MIRTAYSGGGRGERAKETFCAKKGVGFPTITLSQNKIIKTTPQRHYSCGENFILYCIFSGVVVFTFFHKMSILIKVVKF
jgi:uncharacterized protein YqhQ